MYRKHNATWTGLVTVIAQTCCPALGEGLLLLCLLDLGIHASASQAQRPPSCQVQAPTHVRGRSLPSPPLSPNTKTGSIIKEASSRFPPKAPPSHRGAQRVRRRLSHCAIRMCDVWVPVVVCVDGECEPRQRKLECGAPLLQTGSTSHTPRPPQRPSEPPHSPLPCA